ncbi:hypothetical protein [Rheinheimera sp.]|uniref:hypothetical protein n=1 Tax=Rheinheimera sp. TaxID=1869214 RepID=UPI003AF95BCC
MVSISQNNLLSDRAEGRFLAKHRILMMQLIATMPLAPTQSKRFVGQALLAFINPLHSLAACG